MFSTMTHKLLFISIIIPTLLTTALMTSTNISQTIKQQQQDFLKKLNTEIQKLDHLAVPYSEKPVAGDQINSLQAKSFSIPPDTLGLLTNVTPNDVNQIVKKYSSMTRRQQNCLKVRKFLEIFPATPSYFSSFWNWSWNPFASKDPHEEMKSYRTMAYNILKSVTFKSKGIKQEIEKKIQELRDMKILYFSTYYKKNTKEIEKKDKKEKTTQEEISELKVEIKKLSKEIKSLEVAIGDDYMHLKIFVETDSRSKNSVKTAMKELDRLKETRAKIENATNGDEVDQILTSLKYPNYYNDLKDQLQISADYEDLIESLEFLITRGELIGSKNSMVAERVERLKKEFATLQKAIKKTKEQRYKPFDTLIKKHTSSMDNNTGYKEYNKTIKRLIQRKRDLNEKKQKINDMQVKIQQKMLFLETFNIKEYSDFIIPPNTVFELTEKLEQMKLIYTRTGIPAPSLESTMVRMHMKQQGVDGSLQTFKSKYDSQLQILKEASEILKSNMDSEIEHTIKDISDQLYLVSQIEDLERELDELLGNIFSEIFEMENRQRCFTISQLSYLFFSMFKTNIIANQHRFMIKFLSSIRFTQAKEFVIYNYSLFSNKEFIANFENSFNTVSAAPDEIFKNEENYLDQFTVNYLSVINIYKDVTEFGDPSKALQNGSAFTKVWKYLGVSILTFFSKDISEYVVGELVKKLVKKLFHLIPFVSSIPFLDDVCAFIIWEISRFITKRLLKLFSKFGSMITKQMSSLIDSFGSKKYTLDYQKIIQEQLNPKPPSTDIDFSFEDLDKIYHKAYTKETNLYQLTIENARFFESKDPEVEFEKITSSVDVFNEFVMGDLILNRLFKTSVPVNVFDQEKKVDLSSVKDFTQKKELFGTIFTSISTDEQWKLYYYKMFMSGQNEEVDVTRLRTKYIDI